MRARKIFLLGIGITLIYFLIHLAIINDYGVSWDFHYHHYAGLYHLGLPVPSIKDPPSVPFSSPDPRLTVEDPFGPFTQIIPTLSYHLFYEKWKLLPFDAAYNLPMILFGSAGVGLLYFFLANAFGLKEALFGSLFLSLLPVNFGYLHTSMKDVGNAFAFTLSIYLFWRLEKRKKIIDLILAVFAFSLAFNFKINSILIPAVCFAWFIFLKFQDVSEIVRGNLSVLYKNKIIIVLLYFILSPLLAVILWWPFWQEPWKKLLELPYFYSHNTLNMPVLLFGKLFYSGVNVPWYYPYSYILITTPLPILLALILGIFIGIKRAVQKDKTALLFILWFFLPLFRYFSPKSGAIDGVRHFLEIVYPLSAFAGIGMVEVSRWLKRITKSKLLTALIEVTIFAFLSFNIIKFHPYQTSYFNSLVGGIKGAWGKFDIDFWGTPQKEAILWLNTNVPFESNIHVVMAQSSAALYLRPDLLKNLNRKSFQDSDYTVLLNRESFFAMYNVDNYLKQKTKEQKIVFKKEIDGVPLVWIFKNQKNF